MKNSFAILVTLLSLFLSVSCSKANMDNVDGDIPFTLATPDAGVLDFKMLDAEKSKSTISLHAFTGGKMVYEAISLFFNFKNCSVGEEVKPNSLSFGLFLSSNSFNFSSSYEGKIYLKDKTYEAITIRMKDVRFNLAAGEYILNGDLTFTFTD